MTENSIPRGRAVFFLDGLITPKTVRVLLIVLLSLSFAVVVLGAFHTGVNGDEYIFLSNIHRAANGWKMGLLQTAYVHLFGWLPNVSQNEITQIKIGRLINVGMLAVSLALLHRLGRRLLDPMGALVGVVLFATFSFSLVGANEFRIDGLVLPVLLSVALLLLSPTTARVAAAGALSGVAMALTIKSVLWAPAFMGVLAVGLWHQQNRLRPVLAGTVAGVATFIGILMAHRWAIATETDPGPGVAVGGLARLGEYMFIEGLFPMWTVLWNALVQNAVTWLLIAIGVGLAVAGLRQPNSRRNSLILLFLAAPILSVAFYTNAFPYSYIVLIPTACLLAGKAFSKLLGNADGLKGVTALACLCGPAIPIAVVAWDVRHDRTQEQRRVVAVVHQLFDSPVPYIDISGMVASFPRPMFPITRLALTPYKKAGVPTVTNYVRGFEPPLLIVNSLILNVWMEELENLDPDVRLLPEDEETLRATYAHYWDQIYLAGRQWHDLGAGERRAFDIVVPGDHTLLAGSPVTIDGQSFAPGTTVTLDAGPHELRTTAAEPDLRILWGKGLKLPPEGNLQ